MSPAKNGAGSHFAPSSGSDRSSRNEAAKGFEALPVDPVLMDSDNTYPGMFSSPNGSQASIDPSMPIPGSRKATPSETDIFMAVAAQSAQAQASANPAPSAAPQTSYGVPASASGSQPAVAKPSVKNPLVAARKAAEKTGVSPDEPAVAGASAKRVGPTPTSGDLYPIKEVEEDRRGGIFDTSFAEGGGKKGILAIIGIVLVIALIFVGAFFGLRYKQAADARANIDSAIDRLRDSDAVIVPLDTAIAAEIDSGTASESLSNLMLQSSSTATMLTDAETYANEAARSSDLLSAEENDAVGAVKNSVSARRSMLEVGRMLLSADTESAAALDSLNQAYNCIASANSHIQAGLDQYYAYREALNNDWDTSGFDLWGIVQQDNDAISDLAMAQNWVASARESFPEADLTVLDNYLNTRINQVNILVQIDTCIANGDIEGADSFGQAYTDADAASQQAASQVPATAAELLVNSWATTTAAQRDAYDAARTKCVEADAILNAYLGITDVRKEMGVTGDSASASTAPTVQLTDQAAAPDPAAAPEGEVAPVEGEVAPAPEGEAVPEGEVVPAPEGDSAV